MTSRNWNLLKTGGKLVDAPGVRDDNNARDKVGGGRGRTGWGAARAHPKE